MIPADLKHIELVGLDLELAIYDAEREQFDSALRHIEMVRSKLIGLAARKRREGIQRIRRGKCSTQEFKVLSFA